MKCDTCKKYFEDKSNIDAIEDIGECIPCQLEREQDQEDFQMQLSK